MDTLPTELVQIILDFTSPNAGNIALYKLVCVSWCKIFNYPYGISDIITGCDLPLIIWAAKFYTLERFICDLVILYGNVDMAERLIDEGYPISIKAKRLSIENKSPEMYVFIRRLERDELRKICKRAAKLNQGDIIRDHLGGVNRKVLMIAAKRGNHEVLDAVTKEKRNKHHINICRAAARGNQIDILKKYYTTSCGLYIPLVACASRDSIRTIVAVCGTMDIRDRAITTARYQVLDWLLEFNLASISGILHECIRVDAHDAFEHIVSKHKPDNWIVYNELKNASKYHEWNHIKRLYPPNEKVLEWASTLKNIPFRDWINL